MVQREQLSAELARSSGATIVSSLGPQFYSSRIPTGAEVQLRFSREYSRPWLLGGCMCRGSGSNSRGGIVVVVAVSSRRLALPGRTRLERA